VGLFAVSGFDRVSGLIQGENGRGVISGRHAFLIISGGFVNEKVLPPSLSIFEREFK
jgi:hypothetical protein